MELKPHEFVKSADQRLQSGVFTSSLSINEFAGCSMMGLEPIHFVEGYAVMGHGLRLYTGQPTGLGKQFNARQSQSPYPRVLPKAYWQRYKCPHTDATLLREHRLWGANAEQVLLQSSWRRGFDLALTRMLDQARAVGAHGVIGVADQWHEIEDLEATEHRIIGTAVRVRDAPTPSGTPWTTHLGGQRLANMIAMGLMPVSIMVDRSWVAVWSYCVTRFFLEGRITQRELMGEPVQEVRQLSDARMSIIEIARDHLRSGVESDPIHGIETEIEEVARPDGNRLIRSTMRGTRFQQFDVHDPRSIPESVLRLR